MLNKNSLFRASKSETKADRTTETAKGITSADASAREAKTRRLRVARAERDASEKAHKRAGSPKKPSAKARTKS